MSTIKSKSGVIAEIDTKHVIKAEYLLQALEDAYNDAQNNSKLLMKQYNKIIEIAATTPAPANTNTNPFNINYSARLAVFMYINFLEATIHTMRQVEDCLLHDDPTDADGFAQEKLQEIIDGQLITSRVYIDKFLPDAPYGVKHGYAQHLVNLTMAYTHHTNFCVNCDNYNTECQCDYAWVSCDQE